MQFAGNTVTDHGSANPDNDFRFDSTLGTSFLSHERQRVRRPSPSASMIRMLGRHLARSIRLKARGWPPPAVVG